MAAAGTRLGVREAQAPARKAAVAQAAAALVRRGQVLFIDAGSTNTAIARALPERQALTVVTNAPSIATALTGRDGIDVLIIGGRPHHPSGGTLGARGGDEGRPIRADLCFVGACGVAGEGGTNALEQEGGLLEEARDPAERSGG